MAGTENYNFSGDEEKKVFCPACGSPNVQPIPEEDRIAGFGGFALYDTIALIHKTTLTYQCKQCRHEW